MRGGAGGRRFDASKIFRLRSKTPMPTTSQLNNEVGGGGKWPIRGVSYVNATTVLDFHMI